MGNVVVSLTAVPAGEDIPENNGFGWLVGWLGKVWVNITAKQICALLLQIYSELGNVVIEESRQSFLTVFTRPCHRRCNSA